MVLAESRITNKIDRKPWSSGKGFYVLADHITAGGLPLVKHTHLGAA
jgi:hypothetical protein